jgi:uncharacterized SAM-binding protein YcdF (DUF218 family)
MWGELVRVLCRPLAPRSRLRRADAIVVLGAPLLADGSLGAMLEERVQSGVELWRRGWGGRLVLSGGSAAPGQPAEAPAMAARARDLGVASGALLVEDRSRSTRENALRTAELLRAEGLESVIVVTQPYHLRRALAFFQRAGLEATPFVIADSTIFGGGVRSLHALRWVAREYVLWAGYRLRGEI